MDWYKDSEMRRQWEEVSKERVSKECHSLWFLNLRLKNWS